MTPRARLWFSLVVAGLLLALLTGLGIPRWFAWRSDNPIRRGLRLAQRLGCMSCHAGWPPLRNPGSAAGIVPGLASGLSLEREEIAAWIRDGAPETVLADPTRRAAMRRQLLQMPGFGDRLAADELSDLVAFVAAAKQLDRPVDPAALRGQVLATGMCLPCHSVGGAGGLPNPDSATGYIPALFGPDHRDLVEDDAELAEWIETGTSRRVASRPFVGWFLRRQRISMPAFGGRLDDAELRDLMAYVRWLQEHQEP